MAFITSTQGLIDNLNALAVGWEDYTFVYYVSPTTALNFGSDAGDGTAHFQAATSLTGQSIFGASFASAVSVSPTIAAISYTNTAVQTYVGSTTQVVYGMYMNLGSDLEFAQDFSSPVTVANSGDEILLTGFTMQLSSTC